VFEVIGPTFGVLEGKSLESACLAFVEG
jgi:hypothetical protein